MALGVAQEHGPVLAQDKAIGDKSLGGLGREGSLDGEFLGGRVKACGLDGDGVGCGVSGGIGGRNEPEVEEAGLAAEAAEEKPARGLVVVFEDPAEMIPD